MHQLALRAGHRRQRQLAQSMFDHETIQGRFHCLNRRIARSRQPARLAAEPRCLGRVGRGQLRRRRRRRRRHDARVLGARYDGRQGQAHRLANEDLNGGSLLTPWGQIGRARGPVRVVEG
eukprot:scaffold2825_cov111-Isochrysis_galbana.AAC.14